MSSDETETERTFFAGKGVRRVRKFWISDELTKVSTIRFFYPLMPKAASCRYFTSLMANIALELLVGQGSVDPAH